nr:hypothetical protein [Tanacetum cinerariifolium]
MSMVHSWSSSIGSESFWPSILLLTEIIRAIVTDVLVVVASTSITEWEVSSVHIVFSWCGSISFDSFLPSVLLWLVIIVAVVGNGVTIVVIVAIVVVVVVETSAASGSEAPAITQAAIRQLVVDSVATALETQAATTANADNANRNSEPKEAS